MEKSRTLLHKSSEKSLLDQHPSSLRGSHRIRYQRSQDWDFYLDASSPRVARQHVDVSLILPHYRARNQPLDHRLGMFIAGSNGGDLKVKICRQFSSRTPFHLTVHAPSSKSDVTLYLPSDFKGRIVLSSSTSTSPSPPTLSAGFTNHILRNAIIHSRSTTSPPHPDFNFQPESDCYHSKGYDDEVRVELNGGGNVKLRMWDVTTGEVEKKGKEVWKKMFGGSGKCCGGCGAGITPGARRPGGEWDFLLDD
ncbi:hypothetical protein JAAARDRAFT_626254 [Jaapia argillacea MUCL 33604]|uniref:DUF7330 domain-containing protein n=1 Tax=Jaapia argillacea MUCL 33604 TaxID=933084 RepID=A0A067Q0B6_9AGAM|nr:hypothetical protein JAAARDRAFT_626254 [Jaapia argillacea MUCL 33604]